MEGLQLAWSRTISETRKGSQQNHLFCLAFSAVGFCTPLRLVKGPTEYGLCYLSSLTQSLMPSDLMQFLLSFLYAMQLSFFSQFTVI